jgi:hypothetical protein
MIKKCQNAKRLHF